MNHEDRNEAKGMGEEVVPEAICPEDELEDLDSEAEVPTPASPEDGSDRWDEMAGILESIRKSLEIQREMRLHDQNTIAELKAEVASLRRGELRDAQRPLLNSLARLCDVVDKALRQEGSDQDMLAFLREGLLDALESAGLSPMEASEGHAFVRGQHRVVGRVETSNEEDDLTIACLKRGGLVWPDGEAFRPAEVDVFVFSANSGEEAGHERNE